MGTIISKRKLNIFLADLTHTGVRIATENIPLNIGIIASYSKKKFVNDVSVKLFKYPDKLFDALKNEHCDILACSTYIWNNNLNEWAFEVAKRYNPDVITVRGGWNFPLHKEQQEDYLRKHKFTDIFCTYEGEIPFSSFIERMLGAGKISLWSDRPIIGSVFLRDSSLIKSDVHPRIKDLDSIPSPYTTGLLDDFFDGKLTPIIETSRGCPFKCNYCNNANSYYDEVNLFSIDYVCEEIRYIAKKISSKNIKNLMIADTNFGMYQRDKAIVCFLKEMKKKYKWPLGISVSTGKNNVKRIIDNIEVLGNVMDVSMSLQSMNQETLKIIKRDNIALNTYDDMSSEMKKRGLSQKAELIVPLPAETYSTYMKAVKHLMDIGTQRVQSYTLQINNGTVYKDVNYRKKFGYEGKFRLIPYDFGVYEGKRIFDYEEVAVFSKDLSFKEYLEIRKFSLLLEVLYNNYIFAEALKFLRENGVSNYGFLVYIMDRLEKAPHAIRNIFNSFLSETAGELVTSEEGLINHYSDEQNYRRLENGEIGANVVFKHRAIMLSKNTSAWIEFIFRGVSDVLGLTASSNKNGKSEEIADIELFIREKLCDLFVPGETKESKVINLKYDILSWLNDKKGRPLEDFKSKNGFLKYRFYFDDHQKRERYDLFTRYGDDILGFARIMARVQTLERLFRKAKKIKSN